MSLLIDDKDINKVQSVLSQIVKDAIGQVAAVLVPALAQAASNMLGNITVTIGAIKVDPIEIEISIKPSEKEA
jgi:hypothetical protein